MWWLAMICTGNMVQGGISKGATGSQAGREQDCVPRNAHLARGGDHEVQPIHGDVDSDAHASKVQVALAQDGEQGFVGGLIGERMVGTMKTTRTRLPGVNEERGVPQEAPGPQTGQAPLMLCPTALACPRDGQAECKLTFFFQIPFTPGTASYSLLMASLQWTNPGLVTAPAPPTLPSCLPLPIALWGLVGRAPTAQGAAASPQPCPTSRPRYVIPAGATSLLLFPPIDLQQCPSSVSPRAGWVLQGTAPSDPCSLLCTGPGKGEHPGAWGGTGVQESGTAGPYLVTCVRVLKSRDLMERSTSMHPMYCGGKAVRAGTTGQAMGRRVS